MNFYFDAEISRLESRPLTGSNLPYCSNTKIYREVLMLKKNNLNITVLCVYKYNMPKIRPKLTLFYFVRPYIRTIWEKYP